MNRSLMAWVGGGISILLMVGAAGAGEVAVYVSPTGNDAWSGRVRQANAQKTDGPVATPGRAREIVRELKGRAENKGKGVHVYLAGGTWFLSEPLTLTAEDSGTAEAPVIWSNEGQGRPVLSGGVKLSGWTQTELDGKAVWVAGLPELGGSIHELWMDGKRLQPCRWPKRGTFAVAGLSDSEDHSKWQHGVTEFRYDGEDLKAWPGAADGEAIVTSKWVESHLPIASIDEKAKVIRFGKRSVFLVDPGDRYWIENVREQLSEPGEFYVDAKGKRIYVIPPTGIDPNHAEVIAPRLSQILRLEGDPAAGKFVEHVQFRGIAFANAEWFFDRPIVAQQPAGKLVGGEWRFKPDPSRSGFDQADIGVPAAIECAGARSCEFDGCDVSHNGTYGIELSQGCQGDRISRCTLTDLGAGGIKIGEVAIRDNRDQQTFGNEVSDCTIADGGNLFPSCVALWIGQSHDNVVSHNDIHGFWYTAISVGWTWGYGRAAGQHNTIEYNHIHHIGKKTDADQPILSDMGGIYTLGNQEGSVVRFNEFHDIAALKYGGWGIYFDEGTTHILAENNLVYRTTHGGFHQHYGKENTVRNNIFAFGRDAQIQRTRLEDHLSFTFERNVVLWDTGTLLTGDWKKLNVAFDYNTYWKIGGGDIRFAGRTWEQWQAEGMDRHGKIADPHFADPQKGDFRPTAESKAAFAEFEPFDLSGVGPRP